MRRGQEGDSTRSALTFRGACSSEMVWAAQLTGSFVPPFSGCFPFAYKGCFPLPVFLSGVDPWACAAPDVDAPLLALLAASPSASCNARFVAPYLTATRVRGHRNRLEGRHLGGHLGGHLSILYGSLFALGVRDRCALRRNRTLGVRDRCASRRDSTLGVRDRCALRRDPTLGIGAHQGETERALEGQMPSKNNIVGPVVLGRP
eukprot:1195298-Prorocentrum_minimum.AAC.2